jgi:FAD/FMN-containing dehydrogenase
MGRSATSAGIVSELRGRVAGDVIGPADPGYDRHRAVFNARVDCHPAAIARCRTRDDIIGALAARAEHALPVAVRCGATSDGATVDGGIVVDVSPLKGIEIDPRARTARVGGGVTWAELDAVTQAHGLAVTGARLSGLGVVGVSVSGGSGWLERLLGPTCQSLIGAEVVLADGRVVRADADENADLLWALRGGGANFGVLTELEFQLHPAGPTLLSGFLTYPRERAGEVARFYRDYMEQAADTVGGGLVLFPGRGGSCNVVFSFAGPIDDGERAVAPLRKLRPSLNAVGPNEYRAFQSMTDLQNPFGMRAFVRCGFLPELTDDALATVIAQASRPAASLSRVMLRPLGGAMGRLNGDAMALTIPAAAWAYECLSLWPPVASLDSGNIEWTRSICDAMEPFALGESCPGSAPVDVGPACLLASHDPGRYEKLQRVKARYDAEGIFRADPRIVPNAPDRPISRAGPAARYRPPDSASRPRRWQERGRWGPRPAAPPTRRGWPARSG